MAASKNQLAQEQAKRDGQRIASLAKRHASAVATEWDKQLQEAMAHILLVLGNNKGQGTKVANRPDVQYAIARAIEAATAMSVDRLDTSWNSGTLLGNAMARRQARLWGAGKPSAFVPDAGLLAGFKEDLDAIAAAVQSDIFKAVVAEDPDAVKKAVSAAVLRTRMVGEASTKFAAQNALGGAMEHTPGTRKRWVTTSPVPCSHCIALSQLAPILWSEEFPHAFPGLRDLKVYGGVLLGPPRHPNCACVLVAVKES